MNLQQVLPNCGIDFTAASGTRTLDSLRDLTQVRGRNRGGLNMPIYALEGDAPRLPDDGSLFVAPGAHVMGRVRLGKNVGVWFGAVIRGDNEWMTIGDDTNIQDNATLHSDFGFPLTIGAGCTIGHGAIVHGCTIGENSLIGMGATVLNGARIGKNCIVGANALITEGKEFPDNSLIVGAPARAVRSLDEAAAEKLEMSARHYVANAKRFASGLTPIEAPGWAERETRGGRARP